MADTIVINDNTTIVQVAVPPDEIEVIVVNQGPVGPQGDPGPSGGGAVTSVNGNTGAVTISASSLGLGNVNNTSDANKPISTAAQSALDGKAASSHTHVIANTTGLQAALDGKASLSHTHPISETTGLQAALDGKAAVSHTHTIANVTSLQTALDDKSDLNHDHPAAAIVSGTLDFARLPAGSTITITKAIGMYGATAGNWPAARPTASNTIKVIWMGDTDPGALALDHDIWYQV